MNVDVIWPRIEVDVQLMYSKRTAFQELFGIRPKPIAVIAKAVTNVVVGKGQLYRTMQLQQVSIPLKKDDEIDKVMVSAAGLAKDLVNTSALSLFLYAEPSLSVVNETGDPIFTKHSSALTCKEFYYRMLNGRSLLTGDIYHHMTPEQRLVESYVRTEVKNDLPVSYNSIAKHFGFSKTKAFEICAPFAHLFVK